MIEKRNSTIDVTKGIAIILMVVGHTSCPRLFSTFIYQFHMPLFFICSGYFFSSPSQLIGSKSLFEFIKKKFKGLWLPYLYWGIPFMIISPILIGWGYESAAWSTCSELVKNIMRMIFLLDSHYGESQPDFWFIKSLFHASILVSTLYWLKKHFSPNNDNIVLLLLIICSLFLTFYKFEFLYNTIFGAVYGGVYLCIGYLYKKSIEEKITYTWSLGIVCFLLTLCGAFFYGSHGFFMNNYPDKILTSFVFSISGFLTTMVVSAKIALMECRLKRILTFIGRNTMIILALHAPVIRLINVVCVYMFGMPSEHMNEQFFPNYIPGLWILFSLLGIFVPLTFPLFFYLKKKLINDNVS